MRFIIEPPAPDAAQASLAHRLALFAAIAVASGLTAAAAAWVLGLLLRI